MKLSIFVSSPDTELMNFVCALKFEFAWRKLHELQAVFIFTNNYCGCLHSCLKKNILFLKKGGFYFIYLFIYFVHHRKCSSKFFHNSDYNSFTWHCWRGVYFTETQRNFYHDTYMVYSITQIVPKISLFVQHCKFLTCMHLQHSIYESRSNGAFLLHFKLQKVVLHSSDSSYTTTALSPYVRKNDVWRTGHSTTWHKYVGSQTISWWLWNWEELEHKPRGA